MIEFEIVTLKSGHKSLRSLERGETFHPVTGPMAEANLLHVLQQRLVERCAETAKFVIWDVGFGAAANAIAAIEALSGIAAGIEIHSFDKTTAPIEFALTHASELRYLAAHEDKLRRLLSDGRTQIGPRLHWQLHRGDFIDQIRQTSTPAPHAIFYDPYSPAANPEMWTLEHFERVRQRLGDDTPCLLTNYTRSTAVRVTLLLAGFFVGHGWGVGEKDETTIASNRIELLERPLDRSWLTRVQNSANAAPLRGAGYSRARITSEDFDRLAAHPQMQTG